MSEAWRCPLQDGHGECTVRNHKCVNADEICEVAVGAFLKGKHYEEVCQERAAMMARNMEVLHIKGQIIRMRKCNQPEEMSEP